MSDDDANFAFCPALAAAHAIFHRPLHHRQTERFFRQGNFGREDELKPFVAIQRIRLPPGKGAARQPEASLAWHAAMHAVKRIQGSAKQCYGACLIESLPLSRLKTLAFLFQKALRGLSFRLWNRVENVEFNIFNAIPQ